MKNLVLFHMESVSSIIYKLNEDYFPNLYKWNQYFESYSNYYSTATSTVMAMADLFFGDMSLFDESGYLEDIYTVKPAKHSIFEWLKMQGYFTRAYYYGWVGSDEKMAGDLNKVINKNGEMWVGDDEEEFLALFNTDIKSDSPVALFVEENVSHIGYKGKRLEKETEIEINCYKDKYAAMDKTIGKVLESLENKGVLSNTIVIMYGDHGEEYWFHGFYEGYTHAIEPFTSLTHCPLFIFNGSYSSRVNQQLISTTDVHDLILNELEFEKKNVGSDYVFSRNLFANQRKLANIFHKGYSITDGAYTLLLTKKGISMYENRIDVYNLNNILDFFRIKNGKLKYNKKFDRMISSHLKSVMSRCEQEEIEKRFEILSTKMYAYINDNRFLGDSYKKIKLYRGNRYKEFQKKRVVDILNMKIADKYARITNIMRMKKGRNK